MRLPLIVLAAAALIAGCDRPSEGDKAPPRADTPTAPPAQARVNTPTTPANIGQPNSPAEKKEGANPVQGQVDPKQAEQHRDFQQKGDGKGPSSPETTPRSGG